MIILVADSSVLIDLERANLLEAVLGGPDTIAVPDFLYDTELSDYSGPALIAHGLQIIHLDASEMISAQDLYDEIGDRLSLPDCSAFVCSRRPAHQLLTGDRALREHAEASGMTPHGVLWLLDRLHDNDSVAPSVLHDGLAAMAAHRRSRLPRNEVDLRLRRWLP
jgi:hypothetical protein